MNEADFNDVNHNKPPSSKGKGSANIFKVALHLLRKRKGGLKNNSKSKSALPASTNTALNKIIGSVGPLYLQNGVGDDMSPSPPHSANKTLFTLTPRESGLDQEGVVVMSPNRFAASPCHSAYSVGSTSRCSSSRSSSLGGMSSKYASAQSLYDLDNHDDDVIDEENDDDDDGDAYYDGLVGDELIDVKAELFIANFYQQMRIQD